MSLITNVEPQYDAAKSLFSVLLRNQVPVIGVGTELHPRQTLVVYVGSAVSAHALIPSLWRGYPVVVMSFGSGSELN